MTVTLCRSQCTVSEHVCLYSVYVKHCKAPELLKLVWSICSAHPLSPLLQCVTDALSSSTICQQTSTASKGKAILEWVELTSEEIRFCYQNKPLNEEEAIQDGLNKWREAHSDYVCTALGRTSLMQLTVFNCPLALHIYSVCGIASAIHDVMA